MRPERKSLLVRADADAQMGAGHVMRCLALAQAVQAEGDRAIFLSYCGTEALRRRVEDAGIALIPVDRPHPDSEDLARTLAKLGEVQPGWLVLDGYNFDSGYQQAIRRAGHRLLVIDDVAHWPEYHADILLNQNINAQQLRYVADPDTKLLLGTSYALLRPEFRPWQGLRHETPDVAQRVLVTLGGSDPENLTLEIIQALQHLDPWRLDIKIVAGPAHSNFEILRQAVERSISKMQLLANVTNMPELMAWADFAISAGGSTSWELAFMGVPSVIMVLAENQRGVAEELAKRGVVVNLGWHEEVRQASITEAATRLIISAGLRKEMASRGQELVDGEGIDRVLMRLRGERIRLRQVREADGRLLWEWANDPGVRAVSFSPEPIPWPQHLSWLQGKLRDPNCIFCIAVNEEEVPIGQVRCDVDGHEAVISAGLDARCRGKGYGSAVIERAAKKLYQVSEARLIHAYVKADNEASLKAFSKAGFKKTGTTLIRGQSAVDLTLRKEEVA